MALTPESVDRLKAQLLTSGLSQSNQALFQVINLLIDAVRQSLSGVQSLTGGSGGGGGGSVLSQSFVTINNDQGTLINSRRIVAGNGITFNIDGERISIHCSLPFPRDGEDGEMGPIGPMGLQGLQGPMGLMGPPGLDTYYGECCEPVLIKNLSGEEQSHFYSYGEWTPVLTCVTPGDLSVTYDTQVGSWVRIGDFIYLTFAIITTNLTQTTAAGNVQITGLPFTNKAIHYHTGGLMQMQGITKATYTMFAPRIGPSVNLIDILAGGSGVAAAQVVIGDVATGAGNVMLIGSIGMYAV